MPKRTTPQERAPNQSALNGFLGTQDTRPHQRSLNSLWRAPQHERSPQAPTPPDQELAMKDEPDQDIKMKEEEQRELLFPLSSDVILSKKGIADLNFSLTIDSSEWIKEETYSSGFRRGGGKGRESQACQIEESSQSRR